MNWATWACLVLTIVGFGVSIQQIMKVKTAARATEQATNSAFLLIKERINLTEVTAALSYIDAINKAIHISDYPDALGTMRLLRAKLIALKQFRLGGLRGDTLGTHLAALSLLSEELISVSEQGRKFEMIPFLRALEPISDTLNDYAGQMRYMETGQRSKAA